MVPATHHVGRVGRLGDLVVYLGRFSPNLGPKIPTSAHHVPTIKFVIWCFCFSPSLFEVDRRQKLVETDKPIYREEAIKQ